LPAYFYHSPHIWLVARDARNRARDAVASNPDAPAVDAIAAIILAAAASEGFINELAEVCVPKRPDTRFPALLVDFGRKVQEMEDAQSPTLCKYSTGAAILSGNTFDKGGKLYYDFRLLFNVRDALMHIKAIDQAGPQEGEKTTFTMPDLVKTFQGRRLAKPSKKDLGASWLDALETDNMASWACETALNMMLAVLDLIPDFPGDPTDQFKYLLRLHKTLL
jgi:hypothetical protein